MKRLAHYPLRYDAFDDAEHDNEAAYWVGMLMADGCIRERPRGGPSICLSLVETDGAHVALFRDFLGSSCSLVHDYHRGYEGSQPKLKFTVHSEHMAAELADHGVVPDKTARAAVTGLEMNRDFWRGCIDGDGSLGIQSNTTGRIPVVALCGTRLLMNQFATFIRLHAPGCKAKPGPSKGIWQMRVSGKYGVKVIRALYGDCKIALARKLASAQQCLAWEPKRKVFDWSKITHEMLASLRASLPSWSAVARHLGITPDSLHQWRHDHK